ncbi:DUF6191 domain-containing protein [Kitasatospora sp. NPDC004669]
MHAVFSAGKQHEPKERQSSLIQRNGDESWAPPNRTGVDLAEGTATIRLP